jgi:YesN/AraC family two-component response regulator
MIRLIVVDNSPHARHGLCAILATQPGMDIVGEASQGLEALALVEAKQPHVALMDVRMPVMNGIQAAREIKNRWPQVRVILISMYADYQKEALESGADAFLVKGCPAEELVTAIVGPQPKKVNSE